MKALLFLTLAMFTQLLSAQDVIVMRNGDELQTKVLEIGSSEIKYKKFDNQDGPTYTVDKDLVFMIRYENGSKDVFEKSKKDEQSNATGQQPRNTASTSELPQSSFNINPLGLLQFGPVFQFESKIGPQTYITPYFRYAFAGVLTHAVWTGFEEDSELSPGTASIGVGIRSFASTDDSWYYGGMLDLSWASAKYDVGQSYATEEKATTLAIISNFGYRWRSRNSTYVNVGLLAGAAFDLKAEERFINTGDLYSENKEVHIFSMLELAFGWEF